jgi:hypothetical protein
MMTGVAFVLYTNYMVTDPGTTPSKPAAQVAFGAGVAVLYGFYMIVHIPYGLFFATASVCLVRGAFLWALHFVERSHGQSDPGRMAGAAAGDATVSRDAATRREVARA